MKINLTKRAIAAHITRQGNVLCDTNAHYVSIEHGQNELTEVWFPCGGWWPLNEFHVYTWKEVRSVGKTALQREIRQAIQDQLTPAQAERAKQLGYILVMITDTVMPKRGYVASI